MEKLPPTVSVSASGKTLTGKITDSTSGAYGYKFNQSSSSGTISNNISGSPKTQKTYTYDATADGTWYFHGKDVAGNTSKYSVSGVLVTYPWPDLPTTLTFESKDPNQRKR